MRERIVYAIRHNKTERIYIGSTERGVWRINDHIRLLRRGKHKNKLMQSDYDEFGEDYSFYRLDLIPTGFQRDRESFWMDVFRTQDPRYGYNQNDRNRFLRITDFPKIDIDVEGFHKKK